MNLTPLNEGELSTVAEQFVAIDSEVYDERLGLAALIVDAELDVVCLVPKDKAALMVRLLNTYPPINTYTGQRMKP